MIREFRGKYYFLSNFYDESLVEYEGLVYGNAEAAFHAQKDLSRAKQFTGLNPSEAKKLGRKVKLREDWEEVKDRIMYEIVKSKFELNSIMKEKLLGTKDNYLTEGNTWHDNYWGSCNCPKCNGKGDNKLGLILMRVRKELGGK